MKKILLLIAGCLVLMTGTAQPLEVIISGFPKGYGNSVDPEFFKPYYDDLRAAVDTINKYPLAVAVITGGADGIDFPDDHDAKNPALALGRAHALRNLLVHEFGVDSVRVLVQTTDVREVGPEHRFVGLRVHRDLVDIEDRLSAVENRRPEEKHFTEVIQDTTILIDDFGLQFGAGFSSSPFGGIPIVTGAISLKRRVYVEGAFGHTFWNDEFAVTDATLDTKRRIWGMYAVVYPFENIRVAGVAGWMRVEEISERFHEYVRMSEGPALGVRVTPVEFLNITGVWKPSKERNIRHVESLNKNDRFLLSITAFIELGGRR